MSELEVSWWYCRHPDSAFSSFLRPMPYWGGAGGQTTRTTLDRYHMGWLVGFLWIHPMLSKFTKLQNPRDIPQQITCKQQNQCKNTRKTLTGDRRTDRGIVGDAQPVSSAVCVRACVHASKQGKTISRIGEGWRPLAPQASDIYSTDFGIFWIFFLPKVFKIQGFQTLCGSPVDCPYFCWPRMHQETPLRTPQTLFYKKNPAQNCSQIFFYIIIRFHQI